MFNEMFVNGALVLCKHVWTVHLFNENTRD